MVKIEQKCPYCGSMNIAKYLYGYPLLDDEMEEKLRSGRLVLGGCCMDTAGDAENIVLLDPSHRCNDCEKDFGRPPVIVSEDRRTVEYYTDIVMSIELNISRFPMGGRDIYIEKNDDGALVRVDRLPRQIQSLRESEPEMFEGMAEPVDLQISGMKWNELLNTLYNDMHLHEWNEAYDNYDILDGTQWSLEISLTNERKIRYHGSNDYPPYWMQLNKIFKRYAQPDL